MTTHTSARAEAERHAGEVKDTVKEQGGRVTGTAADQTREVAQDALDRAKSLGGELRTTVGRETGQQRDRLVEAIRGFASELDDMSRGGEQSGFAAQATSTVAQQVRRFADSIDGSTGQDLAGSVRAYAGRRPVTFLAGAALAGVVVGRFVRGVQAGAPESGSTGQADTDRSTGVIVAGTGPGHGPTGGYGGGLTDSAGYGGTGSAYGAGDPLEGRPDSGSVLDRGLEGELEPDRGLGEVRVIGTDPVYTEERR
jgi:hypothetical protein